MGRPGGTPPDAGGVREGFDYVDGVAGRVVRRVQRRSREATFPQIGPAAIDPRKNGYLKVVFTGFGGCGDVCVRSRHFFFFSLFSFAGEDEKRKKKRSELWSFVNTLFLAKVGQGPICGTLIVEYGTLHPGLTAVVDSGLSHPGILMPLEVWNYLYGRSTGYKNNLVCHTPELSETFARKAFFFCTSPEASAQNPKFTVLR